MERNMANPAAAVIENYLLKLSQENTQLEADIKEKQERLCLTEQRCAQLYNEVKKDLNEFRKGEQLVKAATEFYEEILKTLERELNRAPPAAAMPVTMYSELSLNNYGRDKFATATNCEVDAEIARLNSEIETMKAELVKDIEKSKKDEMDTLNYCKQVEDQNIAIKKAQMLIEKDLMSLRLELSSIEKSQQSDTSSNNGHTAESFDDFLKEISEL